LRSAARDERCRERRDHGRGELVEPHGHVVRHSDRLGEADDLADCATHGDDLAHGWLAGCRRGGLVFGELDAMHALVELLEVALNDGGVLRLAEDLEHVVVCGRQESGEE